MPRSIIGLTSARVEAESKFPLFATPQSYVRALLHAGATPLIIPNGISPDALSVLLGRLDGVLFTGGGDIEIARFVGVEHPAVYGVQPDRDAQEIALLQLAVERRLPFLGICRGIQLVNVALGGTLHTHILSQLPNALDHSYHDGEPFDKLTHAVRLETGSQLASITGETGLEVNSLHHQGIQRLADSLVATAYAPDGLVEAVELPGHPFGLAVQWHPEWLPDAPHAQALFAAFIGAARGAQV